MSSSSFQIVQSLSLMIPRVFPQWIDEQVIIDIFHKQHIGQIYKVSIIRMPDSKKRDYPIYQAFIYFSAWYDNEIAYNFQQRILGSRAQARIVYDDPWYWVIFENKIQRLSNNDKRLIRLGYKAYIHEQEIIAQDERIKRIEYLTNQPVMEYLNINPVVVPHIKEQEPRVQFSYVAEKESLDLLQINNQIMLLEQAKLRAAAEEILGEELALTETVMNVAELALNEDNIEPDSHRPFNTMKWWYDNETNIYTANNNNTMAVSEK